MKRIYAIFDRDKKCGTKTHPHSFMYTGKIPNTGEFRCIFCGDVVDTSKRFK